MTAGAIGQVTATVGSTAASAIANAVQALALISRGNLARTLSWRTWLPE